MALSGALILALGACGGGPPPDAAAPSPPIVTGPPTRARCVVTDPEGEVILEPTTLAADGRVVDGAEPVGTGLGVVGRWLVPWAGQPGAHGVVLDYPPTSSGGLADGRAHWEDRVPLRGHVLAPREGVQAVLVAVRLQDPATPARVTGMRISLSGSADQTVSQPLLVKPHGARCLVDDEVDTSRW